MRKQQISARVVVGAREERNECQGAQKLATGGRWQSLRNALLAAHTDPLGTKKA